MSPEDARMLRWASSHHPSRKVKRNGIRLSFIVETLFWLGTAAFNAWFLVYLIFLG